MKYIFIHGLGQTPSSWDQIIAHYPGGAQIERPNLFSFVEGREATYENMYQAFREYCDGFAGGLDLCGISLGAVLALNYAIEYPQKITSLALIAPQYRTPQFLLRFQTALFKIMPESAFREMGMNKRNMILLQKSMLKLDFTHRLKMVVCPTLIICGQNDRVNQKAAKHLERLLPHARLELIKGAGHEVNVDAPKQLAEMIIQNTNQKFKE